MRLEVQSEFSNKQALRTDRTLSQDAIDLGEYFYRSGYPADTATASATSNLVEGGTLQANQGRGHYQINRKFGTQYMPFMCQLTTKLEASGLTGLDVEFRTSDTAPAADGAIYADDEEGSLVATSTVAVTATGEIDAGTQIPWPSIPRFVRGRYLFLVYALKGASAATAGNISAAFTLAVPTHE